MEVRGEEVENKSEHVKCEIHKGFQSIKTLEESFRSKQKTQKKINFKDSRAWAMILQGPHVSLN